MFDKTDLEAMSIEDLDALVKEAKAVLKSRKDEAKATAAERKAADKATRADAGKTANVGDTIQFTLKGNVETAVVLKKSDKTVTVHLDGKEKPNYIKFENVVAIVERAVKAA